MHSRGAIQMQSRWRRYSATLKRLPLLLLLLAATQTAGVARGDGDQGVEYQVKAAFIYHFAKYVEWPSELAANPPPTLTVCVLGRSELGRALASIAGKSIRGRRVVVSYVRRVEELPPCDILFVGVSEKGRLDRILGATRARPILTVSDIKRFAASGGIIGFVPVGEKVRFEINQRAALQAKLRISAQLLKLATAVFE
jgi:hypothetical protein